LSNLVKEWETELNIGVRSRIKFISLKEQIFFSNYQNSLRRIVDLNEKIQDLTMDFGKSLSVKLDTIWEKQSNYQNISGSINKISEDKNQTKIVDTLKIIESDIKNDLQYVLHYMMVRVREENLQSMADTMSSSKKVVVLSVCTFVILIFLMWLMLKKKILAPLKILEEGARSIGEGELGLQISVNTKNELSDLVGVLNKMSIQLKKNQDAEVKLQKLETIGQIVTSVNHEINNPLMIISGNAEYLNKILGEDNEKIAKKLNSIIGECRRIFNVTQKLKDIRNPVLEKYVGEETTMIDLKKSS